jgi:DNA-binding transcriptional regulator GbsR (MarR family)
MTTEELEWVERFSVPYCEQYGLPRIGGRIVGLLLIAERPLTLDDMTERLLISRACASTNTRLALTFGFAERVSLPGDRRDYYRFGERAWEHASEARVRATQVIERILEKALTALGPSTPSAVRTRLEDSLEVCEHAIELQQEITARLRDRQATARHATPTTQSAQLSRGHGREDQKGADSEDGRHNPSQPAPIQRSPTTAERAPAAFRSPA